MTSKLQVTIPKVVATAHGITPGTELVFESAGEVIRIRRAREEPASDLQSRLEAFDAATRRQTARNRMFRKAFPDAMEPASRGWRREDLYERGVAR